MPTRLKGDETIGAVGTVGLRWLGRSGGGRVWDFWDVLARFGWSGQLVVSYGSHPSYSELSKLNDSMK